MNRKKFWDGGNVRPFPAGWAKYHRQPEQFKVPEKFMFILGLGMRPGLSDEVAPRLNPDLSKREALLVFQAVARKKRGEKHVCDLVSEETERVRRGGYDTLEENCGILHAYLRGKHADSRPAFELVWMGDYVDPYSGYSHIPEGILTETLSMISEERLDEQVPAFSMRTVRELVTEIFKEARYESVLQAAGRLLGLAVLDAKSDVAKRLIDDYLNMPESPETERFKKLYKEVGGAEGAMNTIKEYAKGPQNDPLEREKCLKCVDYLEPFYAVIGIGITRHIPAFEVREVLRNAQRDIRDEEIRKRIDDTILESHRIIFRMKAIFSQG